MTIELTPPPPLPSLNDPGTFNARALAFFTWLTQTFAAELEAISSSDILQLLIDGDAVQSDTADATLGKLMKVGGFGLGRLNSSLTPSDATSSYANDLNDADRTSLIGVPTSTANRPDPDFIGTVLHIEYNENDATQVAVASSPAHLTGLQYTRSRDSGAWSTWDRTQQARDVQDDPHDNSSNNILLRVGSFGVGQSGGVAAPNGDANECLVPGFNYRFGTGGSNCPVANPYGATLHVFSGTGGNRLQQLFLNSGSMWLRGSTDTGASWDDWVEFYSRDSTELRCEYVTVANDAVGVFTPPSAGALCNVMTFANVGSTFPTLGLSGTAVIDVGPSPARTIIAAGSDFTWDVGGTTPTGTTGAVNKVTAFMPDDGTLQIENRSGASRAFRVSWL